MKTKLIILTIFILTLSFNTTYAQGCEDDLPSTATNDGGVPKTSSFTFFGYIQPQYVAHFTSPATNTFNFKRARFGVRGRASRSFSYYFSIEASDFISADGNIYLLDAFVSYDKLKWVKASLGSFKQPFGLENVTACYALMTIDRSIVTNQLVSPQRDYGLMVLGGDRTTKVQYRIALMNGRGLGVVDNNTKKDVIARITYQPFKYLEVGASYRWGYPNNDHLDRQTYGFEFLANYKGFALQGEFIHDEGDYNRAAGGGCGSTPVELGPKRQGAYIMLSYMSKIKLQPVLKYEYFDADTEIKKLGYQEMFTVGLNYFFNDKTRLQINYQNRKEELPSIKNDALLIQMQIKW
jgi:phosphate-selective porin